MAGNIAGFGPPGKPHLPFVGGAEVQDAGIPAGTRGAINFTDASSVVDDPGNDRVRVTLNLPTGPAGPTGSAGPTGPTGVGMRTLGSPVTASVLSAPTRSSSFTILTGILNASTWNLTENVDNFTGPNSNDRIGILAVTYIPGTGGIQVNYTTNDWDGLSNSEMVCYGWAAS